MVTKPCASMVTMSPVSCQPSGGGSSTPGLLGAQIAEHHVRAAHEQPAALVDARDRLEPRLHAGQQPADGAELVEHRRVERERRRGLGDAVAFEDAQAELLHVDAARRFLHRLGAGEDVAQRAEVVGVRRRAHSRRGTCRCRTGWWRSRRRSAPARCGSAAATDRDRSRTPETSGSIRPTVSPKEWNTGSTLNTLSCRPKSMRAAACAALASMLRWDSTTPFGVPSEPEVNRIAAGSSALARHQRLLRSSQQPAQLVAERDGRRGCPRDRRSSTSLRERRRPASSSRPFSTKAREVTMVSSSAALQAASTFGGAGGEIDHRRHAAGRHQRREASPPRRWRSAASRRPRLPSARERHQLAAEDRGAEQQPACR